MKLPAITGLAAALILGAVTLAAEAQRPGTRAPFWPGLKADALVFMEWFSDVPWHQKLGTFAGNEIDVPIMLPFEALPAETITYCSTHGLGPEACMIEAAVVNVLGMQRIETLYDPADTKIVNAPECKAPYKCVEVRLELSNFWVRNNSQNASVELVPQTLGQRRKNGPFGDEYGGYVITDGTTYAPQMPWEMSHYCDSMFGKNNDIQDSVCYADYLSPFNDGFNVMPNTVLDKWPRSVPWSVYPFAVGQDPPPGLNWCPESPADKCVVAMGGFAMGKVPKDAAQLQSKKYNDFLLQWFNNAAAAWVDDGRHFPWNNKWSATWDSFVYPLAELNPFLGSYSIQNTYPPDPASGCDTTLTGPAPCSRGKAETWQAQSYAYPRQCTLDDLAKAYAGVSANIDQLRQCGLNYEIHHNGWLSQWPSSYWPQLRNPLNLSGNQYGRTSFLFAGIPGMQMPVSFYKDPTSGAASVYEQVHNASIFSLYLPAANIDDRTRAMEDRNYKDTEFYHVLLMSNHMESDPWQFAEGIRGKVLWHNEYRTQNIYQHHTDIFNPDRMFQASFDPLQSRSDPSKAPAPFHNNTCDGCHVRNGSGVPINQDYKLDAKLREFMKDAKYVPYANNGVKDYTFTGVIRPMKLVFFDLKSRRAPTSRDSLAADDSYYNNAVMNYYGDSFHVTPPGATAVFNYNWYYEDASANRVVVTADRTNNELGGKKYKPLQIKLDAFTTPATCELLPRPPTSKPWPKTCADINNAAIQTAIGTGAVGYMLLNGKRLGNLSAIEAIPNSAITGFRTSQVTKLGAAAGEIAWAPGSWDGIGAKGKPKLKCTTPGPAECYIGRFGWIGDRVSLEDQVANAAFVEMNMLSTAGYQTLYGNTSVANPIRYKSPNCGAANKLCVESTKGNSDLSERDIERMADYARWLGNPTRSEIQVSQPEVIAGEQIFKTLQCDTCHVIKRIDLTPSDTMLPQNFQDRLTTHVGGGHKPFLSYIGTDLLMHDMGYLSQVGNAAASIRDANGFVKAGYEKYVQKVRTPPLKGMRFNNYVTDSHLNTIGSGPACDFMLHDGRACNAIEAAFLHDGPAIKQLKVIEGLSALPASDVLKLRAFLYSL